MTISIICDSLSPSCSSYRGPKFVRALVPEILPSRTEELHFRQQGQHEQTLVYRLFWHNSSVLEVTYYAQKNASIMWKKVGGGGERDRWEGRVGGGGIGGRGRVGGGGR